MTNRFHMPTRRTLLSSGLRVSIIVLGASAAVALLALTADLREMRHAWADDTTMRSVLANTRLLLTGLEEAESGEQEYLLTGHEEYLQPVAHLGAHLPEIEDALLQNVRRVPTLANRVSALAAAGRYRLRTIEDVLAVAHSPSGRDAGIALMDKGEGRRAMAAVRLLAGQIREQVEAVRIGRLEKRLQARMLVETSTSLLAGLACFAFGAALQSRLRMRRLVQARLDALMENAAAGIAIFDRDLRCLRANAPFGELLPAGSRLALMDGQHIGELLPDDGVPLIAACAELLATGRRIEGLALRRWPKTVAQRDWVVSLFPIPDEAGRITAIGLITVEVTAQKAAGRRVGLHLQLEEELRELEDPLAMKHAACSLIGQHLGAAQSAYGEIKAPGTHVMVEGGWTDGRVAEMLGLHDIREYGDIISDELMTARVVSVSDIRTDPRIDADGTGEMYERRGIVAFAMVLVVHGGHPCAIFGVTDVQPRAWSETDLNALHDGANRAWSAVERGRAALALAESEQQFARAIAAAAIGVWDWDIVQNKVTISRGARPSFHDRMRGTSCTGVQFLDAVHPDDRDRMAAALDQVQWDAQSGQPFVYEAEFRNITRDGDVIWLRSQGRPTQQGPDGKSTRMSGVTVNVTAQRRAEEALKAAQERLSLLNQDLEAQVKIEVKAREHAQSRLAQAQRLEALAQLSAGIAHDFNNVLQAITGSLALVQRRAGDAEVVRQLAAMAGDAAARGGTITTRLLSFARQGALEPRPVQPSSLLFGLSDILEHMLGPAVTFQVNAAQTLPAMMADKPQLEAVLVSLALNARDAMPGGGILTLGARVDVISAEDPAAPALAGGMYLCLTIADTGTGMSSSVLARASEPFFTTKPVGQGTGLGLAMARGFAEQSGGAFQLTSAAGEGTTVTLWLPVAAASEEPATPQLDTLPAPTIIPRRVLLVDDDALVREVLAGQLEDLGYSVALAQSGAGALARIDSGENIELMITDYAMPGMNGAVLLAETRMRQPRLPVLLLTGYADESLRLNMEEWDSTITLLMRKPVSFEALAKTVQILLEYGSQPAPSGHALAREA